MKFNVNDLTIKNDALFINALLAMIVVRNGNSDGRFCFITKNGYGTQLQNADAVFDTEYGIDWNPAHDGELIWEFVEKFDIDAVKTDAYMESIAYRASLVGSNRNFLGHTRAEAIFKAVIAHEFGVEVELDMKKEVV